MDYLCYDEIIEVGGGGGGGGRHTPGFHLGISSWGMLTDHVAVRPQRGEGRHNYWQYLGGGGGEVGPILGGS